MNWRTNASCSLPKVGLQEEQSSEYEKDAEEDRAENRQNLRDCLHAQ
jgi:hypothetical protein